MKKLKLVLALLLAAVLLLSACGAASKNNYGKTVAATYGDRTIYLDEANFWLRAAELSYSTYVSLYAQYYGVDFWAAESGRRLQNYAESLKEDVMAEFRQMNILLDHASEYNTELTDAELAKIDTAIAEMKEGYGSSLFSESVIGNFSDEALKESIINRTKALKVWNGVREQATVSVPEEECKSFTLKYFRMNDSSSATVGEETVTGEAIADMLEKALNEGTSFEDLTNTYNSLYCATESFRRNDLEDSSMLFTTGQYMQDGQIRKFTDDTSSTPIYYVVLCVSADDPIAAQNARAAMESEQREDYFQKVFVEWQKAAKSFSVKSAFTSLPLPDNH